MMLASEKGMSLLLCWLDSRTSRGRKRWSVYPIKRNPASQWKDYSSWTV